MTDCTHDLVLPDCGSEDVLDLMGAFSTYCILLMQHDAVDQLERTSRMQRRMLKENPEAFRQAILAADPDKFMWLPGVHNEFLDILDLVVINGEVRDRQKTIVYEEGDDS